VNDHQCDYIKNFEKEKRKRKSGDINIKTFYSTKVDVGVMWRSMLEGNN
jgi:hypothetical protein